jgi:hypothetical protein
MFHYMRTLVLTTVLSALLVAAGTAFGAECDGVTFPDTVKAGDADLMLNGLGLRKATMLNVKVYVTGLYLPQKSSNADQILGANQPWRQVLRFVRDVDAADMRDAYEEGFEKSAGDQLDGLRERIDRLSAQIVDLEEGHYLSYDYDPAKGTVVDVNGKAGNPIEGADFAHALLAISIGPEPPNEDLKSGLLGGTCE